MRRRYQIGLRLLLLVTALFAVCTAWLAERGRRIQIERDQVRMAIEAELEREHKSRKAVLEKWKSDPIMLPRRIWTSDNRIKHLKGEFAELPD